MSGFLRAFSQRGRRERSKLIETPEDVEREIAIYERDTNPRPAFAEGYLRALRAYAERMKHEN